MRPTTMPNATRHDRERDLGAGEGIRLPGQEAPVSGADWVAPRLWVGRSPAPAARLQGIDIVVLAAKEHQPQLPRFRGEVIYAGIDDDPRGLDCREERKVQQAARRVADALYAGKRVLCTCHMGWNRSALIAGLALRMSTNLSCTQIVDRMRQARGPSALSNPAFERYLCSAPVF